MHRIEKPYIPLDSVKFEFSEGREGEVIRTRAGKISLTSDQEIIAEELLRLLNRTIHHDGSWRVVWCDPVEDWWNKPTGLFLKNVPETIEFHWLDADGDPILKSDCGDKPWEMIDVGLTYYRDACEEAWQKVYEFRYKLLDIKPEQTFKQAKGEAVQQYQDAPDLA